MMMRRRHNTENAFSILVEEARYSCVVVGLDRHSGSLKLGTLIVHPKTKRLSPEAKSAVRTLATEFGFSARLEAVSFPVRVAINIEVRAVYPRSQPNKKPRHASWPYLSYPWQKVLVSPPTRP